MGAPPADEARQRELYQGAVDAYGGALERLARSYERDVDARRDLLQEIHLALWRSFTRFDGRCSLRTWTYRVAHNVAATFLISNKRAGGERLLSLDGIGELADETDTARIVDQRFMIERLHELLARLQPPDRQLMLLYLEEVDAAAISEITGLSAANVATKIHRLKRLMSDWAEDGGQR